MNKQEILRSYPKEEDRLLVAKVLDKMELANIRNKMTNTDFLDMYQRNILQKLLNRLKQENNLFYGGFLNAERTCLIFYPSKWDEDIVKKNYDTILHVIEIILPDELKGSYTHRDYLGGLMKLGIKREKIGDILTFYEGANIIILNEMMEYVKENLSNLTRFSKANIAIKPIMQLHEPEIKTETLQIIVSSLRVDNIVSELIRTSRAKAEEIIREKRVFVNSENVLKDSKLLKEEDIVTIRGKGRFKIKEVQGNTKKGRFVLGIEKYV